MTIGRLERNPRRLAWRSALGLVAAGAAATAQAAGSSRCTLSATPLVFGQYVPSRNMPSDFTATLQLTCVASGTASANVEGTIGLIGPGGSSVRHLVDGGRRLRYQLFADPARTIPWGDGTGDTHRKSVSGTVGPNAPMRHSFTIYGRILARQSDAAVGNYSDRITAVLDY